MNIDSLDSKRERTGNNIRTGRSILPSGLFFISVSYYGSGWLFNLFNVTKNVAVLGSIYFVVKFKKNPGEVESETGYILNNYN